MIAVAVRDRDHVGPLGHLFRFGRGRPAEERVDVDATAVVGIQTERRVTDAEIPVMGHVGLTPQSVNALGGYRVQGKTPDAAEQLIRDARAVEASGAFAVVLEAVPRELAARITRDLRIPTIGIGAGPDCDGQILVLHDILGLTFNQTPKFARQYANVGRVISSAVHAYCEDVRSGRFPSDAESYHVQQMAREEKEAPVNTDGDW